jgi:hypothetical protein
MLCYKDKIWCTFKECIHSDTCKDFLTKKVKEDADKWWSTFLSKDSTPIMKYNIKPECYET